jgi:prepilin-type N-terminal cleavage/methylation domain-containing protein
MNPSARGFTLIEMLVVLVILTLAATLAVPALRAIRPARPAAGQPTGGSASLPPPDSHRVTARELRVRSAE